MIHISLFFCYLMSFWGWHEPRCRDCAGTGYWYWYSNDPVQCRTCNGTGKLPGFWQEDYYRGATNSPTRRAGEHRRGAARYEGSNMIEMRVVRSFVTWGECRAWERMMQHVSHSRRQAMFYSEKAVPVTER